MSTLTEHAERIAHDLSTHHGFSVEAVQHMIRAVDAGWGTMASFDHAEFGGPGQWMQGGMIMLSEPFNKMLEANIDALCNEIAGAYDAEGRLTRQPGAATPSGWPNALGPPSATGTQNDMHYAYFADTRRLAIQRHGRLEVYDTGDHQITGIAQRQGSGNSDIQFASPHGPIDLATLTPIDTGLFHGDSQAESAPPTTRPAPGVTSGSADDIVRAIERLGDLRERGLLTDEEFTAKKTELLGRL